MASDINPQSILAWVQLSQQLAVIGINAATGIKNAVRALHPGATDAELNAITEAVINDATRRKLLAETDAAGHGPQPTGVSGHVAPAAPQGPVGTDGVTGTQSSTSAPPAPEGEHGKHSAADRPQGGLPGTKSA